MTKWPCCSWLSFPVHLRDPEEYVSEHSHNTHKGRPLSLGLSTATASDKDYPRWRSSQQNDPVWFGVGEQVVLCSLDLATLHKKLGGGLVMKMGIAGHFSRLSQLARLFLSLGLTPFSLIRGLRDTGTCLVEFLHLFSDKEPWLYPHCSATFTARTELLTSGFAHSFSR